MKIYVLASGSKGNATLLISNGRAILIDLGLSLSELKTRLAQVPFSYEDIEAVFYTHRHRDHYIDYKTINKQDVYATKGTVVLDNGHNLSFYQTYDLYGFQITVLPTSHDAEDSCGYVFFDGEHKFVYMTDTGYISDRNISYMKDADFYMIESNHDTKMLLQTNRPYELIQRILGDYGHLSNEDSALYVSEMIGPKTKQIILAHLSEEANDEKTALAAYHRIFAKLHINIDDFDVIAARQNEMVVGGVRHEN